MTLWTHWKKQANKKTQTQHTKNTHFFGKLLEEFYWCALCTNLPQVHLWSPTNLQEAAQSLEGKVQANFHSGWQVNQYSHCKQSKLTAWCFLPSNKPWCPIQPNYFPVFLSWSTRESNTLHPKQSKIQRHNPEIPLTPLGSTAQIRHGTSVQFMTMPS